MSEKQPRVPGTTVRPVSTRKRLCLVIGGEHDPVVAVLFDEERAHTRDSGYRLFTANAPRLEKATDEDFGTYCLGCLRKRHPEAERGLLLARVHGYAWWDEDEGEWIAEDEDGNEIVFVSGDEPIGSDEEAAH